MRPNKIRQLLDSGHPTFGTHVHSVWPPAMEILGHTGQFDYVEVVAEYTSVTLSELENLCRAAELHDLGTMLKVDQASQAYWAQRGIGAGFQSVLFTDVRTPEEAEQCVRIVKPETPEDGGIHGVKATRMSYLGQAATQAYVDALRDIVIVLMIEKASAVEQLKEILSVPGIDMIQWGPADYSMSVGKAGMAWSDEMRAVERSVFETALSMGVPPRAEIGSVADVGRYLEMGAVHFSLGADTSILQAYWQNEGSALRSAVGQGLGRS